MRYPYKIVADSSANLSSLSRVEFASAPLHILVGDQEFVDVPSTDLTAMQAALDAHNGPSSTTCPNPGTWKAAFGDAETIFCVTLTSKLSGTYDTANIAKQMYEKEHPGRKVYVYDTLSTGPEMVLLIEKIREMILAGASAEEIDRAAHDYMHHTHLLFSLASIYNLAKNGRMNRVVAKGISLLGIRVVGTANEVGALEMLDKCRGDQRAIICMIEHMKKRGYSGGRVIIAHNGNQPAAEALRKQIKKAFGAVRCDIHPTRGLCSYYAEPQSLLLGFES